MGRNCSNQKNFVISFRVNDEEKKALDSLARKSGHSLSSLIRSNLDLFPDQVPHAVCTRKRAL